MSHRSSIRHITLALAYLLLLQQNVFANADELPNCNYEDTVDLTEKQKFDNGSVLYEGILIPPELIGTYDYHVFAHGERKRVPEHSRGCVCKLKSCVKFCCHPNKLKIENSMECYSNSTLEYESYIDVSFNNGSKGNIKVLDEFALQMGIPCDVDYLHNPAFEDDDWELFENGTLLIKATSKYVSKHDYCLTPHEYDGDIVLVPRVCHIQPKTETKLYINAAAMLVSIPFLVLTIFVYLYIPELRNLHGKCFVSYLVALTVGYTILVSNTILSLLEIFLSRTPCHLLGYFAYFFFMSAFLWLSVISFDLWQNFQGTSNTSHRYSKNQKFYLYSLYAWGFAALFTAVSLVVQESLRNGESYKWSPGIGDIKCWIDTDDWSAMIYFYGPCLLLLLFNLVVFILTAIKIYKINKDSDANGSRRFGKNKEKFWLFLRLFILMGISWLFEIASYMIGNKIWSSFFIIIDFINAAQGILIFVLFVLNHKVINLIKLRMCARQSNHMGITSTNSTNSEFSQEELPLQNRTNANHHSHL